MTEYLELGSVPSEEECVQVGASDYDLLSRQESVRYIQQLQKCFPQYEEFRVRFSAMNFPHDFGYYKEVVVKYEPNSLGEKFVYFIEKNLPDTWDNEKVMIMNEDENE